MNNLQYQIDSIRQLAIYVSILKSPDEFFHHMNGHTTELSLVLRAFEIAENAEVIATALERSPEPTASEFLSKAKAICNYRGEYCTDGRTDKCPVFDLCTFELSTINEAKLIQAVMDYRLEDTHGRID